MRLYWTLKSIPELSQISSKERGRRWRIVYKSAFRHWEMWGGLALMAFLAATGSHFFGAIGAMMLSALGGFIYGQVVIFIARKYYRHLLLSEPT